MKNIVERFKYIIINKKKIIIDFSYSIIASIISVSVLQIIVYPILAKSLNSSEYGQLLTSMGIINTISISLGNTLNNTRLIQETKYINKNIVGDFNIILTLANIIGIIIVLLTGNSIFKYDFNINIFLTILVALIITKSYLIVGYRIKLNFKLSFLHSIISSIGYLIGIFIVFYTSIWPIVFISSEIFSIVFLIFTTDLHREPYRITKLFRSTSLKYLLLILTGFIGNILTYLDRLIIYPILGGEFVSAYTTAAFFGKSLGIIMTPIAGVLLGYFSQKEFNMTLKKFWSINFIVLIFSVLFFILSWIVSPWFTGILYPTLIDIAEPYIFYANLASIIGVLSSLVQPIILRYAPTFWQVVKEMIFGGVYICLGFVLINGYGLFGFCIAAIISNAVKLSLLYIIGTYYVRKYQFEGSLE